MSGFLDTELLVVADLIGLCVHEVSVDWIEAPTASSRSSIPPARTRRMFGGLLSGSPPAPS